MNCQQLKNYITSLDYLSEEKRNSYLKQADTLDEKKINQVYLALLEKTTTYYAEVGNLVEKFDEEMTNEEHKERVNTDQSSTKSDLDSVRDSINDI
ncbi:hypothetical protein KJ705_00665 [Patescibacteria group bacterium]|nr:hypothetical protein [Patescibacteria group bacterium]